ncbi:MAG: LemA family protein [Elusimicrobiota bacterium]|jgi:LemA protein
MGLVLAVVIGLILLVTVIYSVSIYNGLILVTNNINKAWANIDVLLKQRHDELPKLIEVCKGYMAHEAGTLEAVIKARQSVMTAQGPAAIGQAEGILQGAMRQLFALAENYPNLKAQTSFQQLQERVSALESQIADRREFYNDSVNTYNIRIATLPDVFIARSIGLTAREMFQVAEGDREDVKISFKNT